MPQTGLTEDQRTLVRDASRALRYFLTERLAETGDAADDHLLRSLDSNRTVRADSEDNDLKLVAELRRPDRAGGPISWQRIGDAAGGMSRQAAEKRWGDRVADLHARRAAEVAARRGDAQPSATPPQPQTPTATPVSAHTTAAAI